MYSSYVWNSLSKKTPSTPDKTKRLFEETMEKNTASLFAKYNVQINSSLLQDLKISLLNTFTVQYLGFGNELPAFPLIIPYFEWIFRLTKNPLPRFNSQRNPLLSLFKTPYEFKIAKSKEVVPLQNS